MRILFGGGRATPEEHAPLSLSQLPPLSRACLLNYIMDTLSLLGNSSLALLHTIKSHPSPFPPPPQPTRSNKLATLRAEHAQLHQQLQQAHIAAVATRKAALALAAAAELQQPVEQRERQLKQRVQELKVQVEEQQGRSQVRQGIVNACVKLHVV